MLEDPAWSRKYGFDTVPEQTLEDLRRLRNEIGGWVTWRDGNGLDNPVFVNWAEFKALHEAFIAGAATQRA